MNSARVLFFGLTATYLLAVLVQFFLAGLAVFGSTDWDPHAGVGFALTISTVILLVLAVVGRLPRRLVFVTVLLVGLNALQLVLPNIDVSELAALHVVNAVAIVFVAYALMHG